MTHPTGPAGGGPGGASGTSPKLALLGSFEGTIIGGLILMAVFIAIAWVRGQS